MKLPSMPFYVGDWLKDPGVRSLTHEERGIYVDILCIMWENYEQRGYLTMMGRPIPTEFLAHMLNLTIDKTLQVVDKLILVGCLRRSRDMGLLKTKDLTGHNSRDNSGDNLILYNSRMVRDEILRKSRSKGGIKGGNPNFRSGKPNPYYAKQRDLADDNLIDNLSDNLDHNLQHNLDDNLTHNQKITSLSLSVSEREKESLRDEKKPPPNGLDANATAITAEEISHTQKNGSKRGTRMTKDWKASKALEDFCWLECPDVNFTQAFADFIDHWVAVPGKAGLKLDWEATLRNWLRRRQQWADERKAGPMGALDALAKSDERNGITLTNQTPKNDLTTIFDDDESLNQKPER